MSTNGIGGDFSAYNAVPSINPIEESETQGELGALSQLSYAPQTDLVRMQEQSMLSQLDNAFSQGQPQSGTPASEDELAQALAMRMLNNQQAQQQAPFMYDPMGPESEQQLMTELANNPSYGQNAMIAQSGNPGRGLLQGGGLFQAPPGYLMNPFHPSVLNPQYNAQDGENVGAIDAAYAGNDDDGKWKKIGENADQIIQRDGANSVLGRDAQAIKNDMNNHVDPGADIRQLDSDLKNNVTSLTPHAANASDGMLIAQAQNHYSQKSWSDLGNDADQIISQDGPDTALGRDAQAIKNDMNLHEDPGADVNRLVQDAGLQPSP